VGGVDGATRTERERIVLVENRNGGGAEEQGILGNGKGRWVGARVCLNRDLRNLSLEFPVKD